MEGSNTTQSTMAKVQEEVVPVQKKSSSSKPLQVDVEEKLYYSASITDRTEIRLEETTGKIEIVFPAPLPVKSKKGKNAPPKKSPTRYLALSNYEATVWQPPLPDQGIPLKIPINVPGPDIETRSSMKLNYALGSEGSKISTGPVRLDVEIIDRSSSLDAQANLNFVDGLRLVLGIRSAVDPFSEIDEEKVAGEVRSQIEQHRKEQERLQNRLKARSKPNSSVQAQTPEQNAEDSEDVKTLRRIQENLKKYETLLKGRESNLLRRREFLSGVISHWNKYHSDALKDLVERLRHKVKLGYLELKTPYIRQAIPTTIFQKRLDDQNAEGWLAVVTGQTGEATPVSWQYNPERNALELREQPLTLNNDTNLYEAHVYLDLDPPDEDTDKLTGSVVLYLDDPISGIKVGWSSTPQGQVDYGLTNYRTWLILDFEISFADVFRKRTFLMERKLHFEGVVFHPDHILNIRHILNNHELLVISQTDQNSPDRPGSDHVQTISKTIVAIRQGIDLDIVSLQISGQIGEGTHTITYNQGEEQLSKAIPLGTLNINLSARMAGQSQAINELLNILQMDLEHYFTSCAVTLVKEDN